MGKPGVGMTLHPYTECVAGGAVQRLIQSGAGFLPPLAPSPSLLSGSPLACSQGLPVAAARRDVAPHSDKKRDDALRPLFAVGVIWYADRGAPREGSLVGQGPIETPKVTQREAPEPGPQDAPSDCLLQCLYLADRCTRDCAGCAVTTGRAAREGAPLAGKGAAQADGRQCDSTPDGNHGGNDFRDERSGQ